MDFQPFEPVFLLMRISFNGRFYQILRLIKALISYVNIYLFQQLFSIFVIFFLCRVIISHDAIECPLIHAISCGINRVVCQWKYHAGAESEEMLRQVGIQLDYVQDEVRQYDEQ